MIPTAATRPPNLAKKDLREQFGLTVFGVVKGRKKERPDYDVKQIFHPERKCPVKTTLPTLASNWAKAGEFGACKGWSDKNLSMVSEGRPRLWL